MITDKAGRMKAATDLLGRFVAAGRESDATRRAVVRRDGYEVDDASRCSRRVDARDAADLAA